MHDPKLFLLLPEVHQKACRRPWVFIKMVRKCFASPGASQRTGIYWVLPLEAFLRSKTLDWKSLKKKITPILQAVVTWSCFRDPNHPADLLKSSGFRVSPLKLCAILPYPLGLGGRRHLSLGHLALVS